jgi:hypothetical protein
MSGMNPVTFAPSRSAIQPRKLPIGIQTFAKICEVETT